MMCIEITSVAAPIVSFSAHSISRRRCFHYCCIFGILQLLLLWTCVTLHRQTSRRRPTQRVVDDDQNKDLHPTVHISIDIPLRQQLERTDLHIFDGHGGLSAGGSSRLLVDYPEPQRSDILDYLFLPHFGASLAVLKLEIGGDAQSTVGTEPSYRHSRDDQNQDDDTGGTPRSCRRTGYEGWLAQEARRRNPNIVIWSLSWGVPGWIGNGTSSSYYTDDNIDYQIGWLQCLRHEYNVESNYIGLWNERPQGSVEYVTKLRKAMDQNGFQDVGITIEATWQRLVDKVLEDPTFNQSVAAATMHYPCNRTCLSAQQAHKKVWAGEDTPTPFQNWTAASCWGRKLNQHFLKLNMTSVVSWAIVWSALQGISVSVKVDESKHQFRGNAFMTAEQPWSGHYTISPVLWIQAHWGQFVQPGWRFLDSGNGSGFLPNGGSYVSLIPPLDQRTSFESEGTFVIIIETLHGTCGDHPVACDVSEITDTQQLTFHLGSFHLVRTSSSLHMWCSNFTNVFESQPTIQIENSSFSVNIYPDTICTISTSNVGNKGQHADPPSESPFPKVYRTNFDATSNDHDLAWGFSDVYGSFAIRDQGSLTQMASALPIGWAPVNEDPLTLLGDPGWDQIRVRVSFIINHTASHHYVRVCGGCGNWSDRRILFGCPAKLCFNISGDGHWRLGNHSSFLPDYRDIWHELDLKIDKEHVWVQMDGQMLVRFAALPLKPVGMIGLGCGSYHACSFRNFSVFGQSSSTLDGTDSLTN